MALIIEISDMQFCQQHLKETCEDCECDLREDNDGFYGLNSTDRDPIPCPSVVQNRDGTYSCVKHGSAACSQCFAWKKMLISAQKAAKARA